MLNYMKRHNGEPFSVAFARLVVSIMAGKSIYVNIATTITQFIDKPLIISLLHEGHS